MVAFAKSVMDGMDELDKVDMSATLALGLGYSNWTCFSQVLGLFVFPR